METFSVTASAKSDDAVCKYLEEPIDENKNSRNILRNEHGKKKLNEALNRHIIAYNPVVDWCNNYSTYSSQYFDEYKIYIHSDLMDGRPRPKKNWCVIM
ncbi:pI9R [African swine fever virus]|uniref:PI9R n=1 Tax=African swine fever virus TaxID=10497 RepID=A0A0A1DXW6_ASF|nr:pI9R [African swine fever virus]AIY22342.1 pI9R [African swine fever virus]